MVDLFEAVRSYLFVNNNENALILFDNYHQYAIIVIYFDGLETIYGN